MWKKVGTHFDPVDSKIVDRDYIVATGSQTVGPKFVSREKHSFQGDFFIPIFYLFKIHKNHPLKIFSPSVNHNYIYPAKKDKRMPSEVYEDRMAYDLSTFVLYPFDVASPGRWKKFNIENGFVAENGERRDANLLYLEHGMSLHDQDSLTVSEVMPSHVVNHFYSWLYEGQTITSHEKTFDKRLEGKIEIPIERNRELTAEVCRTLEDRYNTRLSF